MTPFSKGEVEEDKNGKDELKEGEEEGGEGKKKEPEFRFTSLIVTQHENLCTRDKNNQSEERMDETCGDMKLQENENTFKRTDLFNPYLG